MDVRCERCSTEYEFDDALVSGRGTTVKCTNCGHKFKIRRSDGDYSEDFWNVTTADGRTLVFTSLRELQRAIQTHLVERADKLSRGGRPPKPIGSIPELAPFFDQRDNADRAKANLPPMRQPMDTATGLAPPPPTSDEMRAAARVAPPNSSQQMKSSRPPPPPGATPPGASPPQARQRMASRPPEGAPAPYMTQSIPLASVKSTLIGAPQLNAQGQVVNATPPTPVVAPVATPEAMPAPPAMRSRMASVPPPATEREPEPDTQRFDPPAKHPSSKPPPLPARARSSRPPAAAAKQVTATTPVMPITSSKATQLGVGANATPAIPAIPAIPATAAAASAPPPMNATMPMAQSSPLPRHTPPPAVVDTSSPLPPPTPPVLRRQLISEIDDEEVSPRGRRSYASFSDAPASMGRRRSVGGFIVAAVVIGCMLLLGAVWVQKNGLSFGTTPKATSTAPATDPRAATFLTNGEKALADGNLDLAKESFDKASALAERDPHVLLDVARLAASRADVVWLKSRLLPSDATDEHKITRESLGELSQGARKAADDALAVAPDDPAALRAKIDALRISGDRDAARPLVDRIKGSMAQPETAYVLAALDLAEAEPLWSTVIDRLKIATAVESGPGRARAALVYALARSGNVAGAREELDRLKALPRQHGLVPQLAAFVERSKGTALKPAAGDAGAADAAATIAANDLPDPKNPHAKPGAGDLPRDPRALVAMGEKARVKGDYENAKRMYNAAIEINPNDSEALAGLGAVAYAQRDLAGARSTYKRVLSVNPNYTPALVGLGDVEWDSGDRGAAMKIYKDIVDRLPEGAYPARVKQRIEAGGGTPPPPGGDRSDQGGF